ncbi:MAG: CinA family protein [Candidatus Gastranaerophilales bacterium]|nr:CinA family protein [Candidatus Gastranaerophilales bacterium]
MFLKKIFVNIIFIIKNIFPFIFLLKEKKTANYLIKNGIKISTAESCTGGLLSSRLTDVSGSSVYIFQNLITYSNEAKINLLHVKPSTIEQYGVVSRETALEMAQGLLKNYDCNIAVSATGIAGPLGASDKKPLGLVYIGIANEKISKSYKFEAEPLLYRRLMKYAFSNKAFDLLIEFLKENY